MEQLQEIVRVFLFTDLVGSTDLKQRLGDSEAARRIALHNEVFRKCLAKFYGHEEANPGDGFFATFDVPSHAVLCGLSFQRSLSDLPATTELKARVGIHMGQTVRVNDTDSVTRGSSLLGLSVDTAARVMSLAEPGQILLTRAAFDSVRQYVRRSPDDAAIEWLAHGPYRLTGVGEPIDVFEVGVEGLSPLRPPRDSDKAKRVLGPEDADTMGWRPAAGQAVPGRSDWIIEQKLGDGGVGEAWLAVHRTLHEHRVFKFCFDAERMRALKREIALLRTLRDSLGERADIARILDWHVAAIPYYLESEYASGGSLPDWFEAQGGIQKIALAVRIEIVARIADAIAAAHAVGVLHRDIKPSIVLVTGGEQDVPRVRLTDFGIGLITNPGELELAEENTVSSASRIYMAPELLIGEAVSTYSDVYSLGVFLYQIIIGDLRRPIGIGWERDVQDPLLREDVGACIDGEPQNRLASAAELATRLRTLDDRREEARRESELRAEADRAHEAIASERERRRRHVHLTSLALTVFAILGMLLGGFEARQSTRAIERAENIVIGQMVQSCRAAAHWMAGAIGSQLDDVKYSVATAAKNVHLVGNLERGDLASLYRLLEWIGEGNRVIQSWVIAGLDGHLIASYPALSEKQRSKVNLTDRPWFKVAAARPDTDTEVLVSEPFQSVAEGHHVVVGISAPIHSEAPGAGRLGILLVTLKIDDLTESIRSTPVYAAESGPEGESAKLPVVIVNQADHVVLHPKNPLATHGRLTTWPATTAVRRAGEDSNASPLIVDPLLGNDEYYFGARQLAGYGWLVVVMAPKQIALSHIDALVTQLEKGRKYFLLVTSGAVAMALVGLFLFVRERRVAPQPRASGKMP